MFIVGMLSLIALSNVYRLGYEEKPVRLYGLERLISVQDEIYRNASRGYIIYCNGFTNLSFRGGCNISVDGWRSRNCFFDMMEKSIGYFNSTHITSANLEEKLEEFVNYMDGYGYNCSYEVNVSTSCNAARGFRVVCKGNEVETREGLKQLNLVLKGGVS